MALSTRDRMFVFASPLGEDALLVHGMEASEALSQPYHVRLALVAEQPDVASGDLVGKRASLRVETPDGERFWTGVVSRFVETGRIATPQGENAELFGYGCELVPWVWHLLHHEDSRIFQAQSVPDIVEAVFADFGYSDYELHLSGEHPPLPYCVQYRERNLDFIARLLEREGIHYFFRHDAETEVMVLTDNRDHAPRLDPDSVPFHATALAEDADSVTRLVRRQGTHTGRFVLRDYDFERPTADLEVAVDTVVRLPAIASHERFVHPGGYVDRDRGDALARVLMEAEEAGHETFDGEGNVRLLGTGSVFALVDHPDDARNIDYLVTAVEHRGSNNLGFGDGAAYHNRFSVIPHAIPFRAPVTTPRPRVHGPQTAVVVGPAGEEIHTDKYGRVRVKFRWDRTPHADDRSSCWLRVAQMWAGRQWGAMFVPRIGMEVLVDFLEGDPDQPLVVGCLYNGDNMPPYELPAEATKSTLKTDSSKGGGGFNEIRFEDKKDAEQLFLHAQKDMDQRVGNDSREWVERDRSLVVKRDRLEEVHRSHHSFTKKDR
ncbi:MAG TPA: type VI secretion system tip protein VgrG, partial [Luteimonas sp.]|nr:type VI secretion system tip protein VgrG [Luteimonas sp.]